MSLGEIERDMRLGRISPYSAATQMLAYLETALLREFLADKSERPDVDDCHWIKNAPQGPSAEAIREVQKLTETFGIENVTTGNAIPVTPRMIGLYVRREAFDA